MGKASTTTPAAALAGTELLFVTQAGETVVTTPLAIATYIWSGYGPNSFPARSSSGALSAKPISDFALTVLDDVDAAAVRSTIGAQAADATLTALAGTTTGANKLLYFSGVDTTATTDLSAFIRTVLDDADAATARTTLGVTEGTYTPTLTNTTNITSSTPANAQWVRSGNKVTVSGTLTVQATAAAATLTTMGLSLPVASDILTANELAGVGALLTAPVQITGDATNNRATLQWNSATTSSVTLAFHFTYRVQ